MTRTVLDTNVVVSALFSPGGTCDLLVGLCITTPNRVVVSEDILAEYRRVLTRNRFQELRADSGYEASRYLVLLTGAAIKVQPESTPNLITRDPTDNMILAAAHAGDVDYIASGDRHLLELGEYAGIPIMPPAALLQLLMAAG